MNTIHINTKNERDHRLKLVSAVKGLSHRHKGFVLEYIKDFSPRRAAEVVGVTPEAGHAILKREDVQEAIAILIADRVQDAAITADWVLWELVDNHMIARQQGNISASNKALALLMNHISVDAMAKQKIDVSSSTSEELVERLRRGRKRISDPTFAAAQIIDHTPDSGTHNPGTTTESDHAAEPEPIDFTSTPTPQDFTIDIDGETGEPVGLVIGVDSPLHPLHPDNILNHHDPDDPFSVVAPINAAVSEDDPLKHYPINTKDYDPDEIAMRAATIIDQIDPERLKPPPRMLYGPMARPIEPFKPIIKPGRVLTPPPNKRQHE